MTKEEKAQYDKRKLFNAVGIVCIVCCVLFGVMGYLGHRVDAGLLEERFMLVFAAIFVVVILLTILFVGIYKHKGKEKNRLTGRI